MLISEVEKSLPENTPDNPEPTTFKVSQADLNQHEAYVLEFNTVNKYTEDRKDIEELRPSSFQNTDVLTKGKDEYLCFKTDKLGEAKITDNGHLLGGRKYLLTTFTLPGRGKKLYVLGNEAAKLLNHRDAFVLFNKFKQLYKYTVNEEERKFLEEQGFSISRIKTRAVAVTTARNLFMVFGARVVQEGKRVKDDYWEDLAIEQGFNVNSQVFPVEERLGTPELSKRALKSNGKSLSKAGVKDKAVRQEKIRSNTATLLVRPLPSLEERKEYLEAMSNGQPTQILPGQGITGGLELGAIATVPKYKSDPTSGYKHKTLLSSLATGSSTILPVQIAATTNHPPINNKLSGTRSPVGLPYYKSNIMEKISNTDQEKLKLIEYVHGTVETNNYISIARNSRKRQWSYYWQSKSGTPITLTRKDADKFLKEKEEFLEKVETEVRYNENLGCDQVISKKIKPNPNYLNHGNLRGLKPPYADKPDTTTISQDFAPK